MFSRSSIRHLKHKAKKSVLIRIGKTESSQEDPAFKDLLANVNLVRSELKNMHYSARLVVITGRQYIESLAKFCGNGLKGEELYNKEAVFLRLLEERVCPAIGSLLNKDLQKMGELVVEYKSAKLKFDTANFKSQKDIEKKGMSENDDEVNQINADLAALNDSYIASKLKVIEQRDVLLSHLDTKVGKTLEELREATDIQQHQLYCQYIKDKISNTAKMCVAEGTSTNPFKPRSKSLVMSQSPLTEPTNIGKRNRSFSEEILRHDDEKISLVERSSPLKIETLDEAEVYKVSPVETYMEQSEDGGPSALVAGQEEEKDNEGTSPGPIASEPPRLEGEHSDNAKMTRKFESPRKEMSGSPREESL